MINDATVIVAMLGHGVYIIDGLEQPVWLHG